VNAAGAGFATIEADVLVVGAGPAGIAAAVTASAAGASVVLVDEGQRAGGQIWRGAAGAARDATAAAWLARLRASAVRHESGVAVVAVREAGRYLAERAGEAVLLSAPRIVVATGARELFLPFPGWTLPAVLGVGGAQALLKSGASFSGLRVVIAGTGPLLLPVAAALAHAGARIRVVAEQARLTSVAAFGAALWRRPLKAAQAVRYRAAFAAARYRTGTWVAAATGTGRVASVRLTNGRSSWSEDCDVLACAYGLVPNLELPRALGCTVGSGFVSVDARQATSAASVWAVGETTGIGGVLRSLLEGEIAGLAATDREIPAALRARHAAEQEFASGLRRAFALRSELRSLAQPDTILCRCEDVAFGRVAPAWSRRQAKLYTRIGMGSCQGRICGAALDVIAGAAAGPAADERPPQQPVRVSTLLE
jgi:thioredoxin reductase